MMGLLSSLVMAGATLVGLVILGVIFLLGVRFLRPSAPAGQTSDEDARLIEELGRTIERLEARVESLETLVLGTGGKGRGPCDT